MSLEQETHRLPSPSAKRSPTQVRSGAAHDGLVDRLSSVRSPARVARRVAEDDLPDPEQSDSELVQHILALRASMTAQMRQEVALRTHSASPCDREARMHAVDFNFLRDLRTVFSKVDPETGLVGIREDDFVRTFGPCVCGPVDEEVIYAWCRGIDRRCAGVLSWRDLSTYLVKCASSGVWMTRHVEASALGGGLGSMSSFRTSTSASFFDIADVLHDSDATCEVDDLYDRVVEGKSFHKSKAHNDCVTKILPLPHVGSLLTASTDGSIRRWDHHTLQGDERPLHVGNEWVTGLVKVSGVNRIGVLHADRSIFFYNISQNLNRGKGFREPVVEYYRGFAQESVFTVPVPPTNQYVLNPSQVKKHVPGEPAYRAPLPVTLIASKKASATALAHLNSTPVAESVLIGSSDGSIEHFQLRVTDEPHHVVPRLWQLTNHHGRVSHIQPAPELQGFVSSGGVDGKIAVTNLEHLMVTQTMYCDIDHRRAKPILQFDYQPQYHHLLVHGYGRHVCVWNALTGVRNHTVTDADHVVLACALDPQRHRMYALTERKSVRVYDVRTWKLIQTVADDTHRIPVDEFGTCVWSEATNSIVTGACNLITWRTAEAQRTVEDNAGRFVDSPTGNSKRVVTAHIHPILQVVPLPDLDRVITVDPIHVSVWSSATHRRLNTWPWNRPSAIMCVAAAASGRKLLIGSDDGKVVWVSSGTGDECARMLAGHIASHFEGSEVSACMVERESPVPKCSLCVAAVGRYILGWVYDVSAPVTPAAEKDFHVWASIELSVADGIVHSFAVSGPGRTCFLAATNSGRVVAFNSSVQQLYIIQPPSQIASELLHSLYQHLLCVTYSDGSMQLARVDCGRYDIRLPSFWAARATGECVTCVQATVAETKHAFLIACGDSSGYVSIFHCAEDALRAHPPRMSLVCCWRAHTKPVTAATIELVGGSRSPEEGTAECEVLIRTASVDGRLLLWRVEARCVTVVSDSSLDSRVGSGSLKSTTKRQQSAVAFTDEIVSSGDDSSCSSGAGSDTDLSAQKSAATKAPDAASSRRVVSRLRRKTAPSPSSKQQRGSTPTATPPPRTSHTEWVVELIVLQYEIGGSRRRASSYGSHCEDVAASHAFLAQSPPSRDRANTERGQQRRTSAAMSKRFLSFSNLLAARDREHLFDGTLIHDKNGSILSKSFVFHSVSHAAAHGAEQPSEGELGPAALSVQAGGKRREDLSLSVGSGSLIRAVSSTGDATQNSPSPSKLRSRYRLAGTPQPASAATPGFVEELKRPLSRVEALRRVMGTDEVELCDSEGTAVRSGSSDGGEPRPSVEKRLQSLQRRQQEREEGEGHEYRSYFSRLELQRFGVVSEGKAQKK